MRRAALRARDVDPTAVWLGYWRFLQIVMTATTLAWMGAVFAFRTHALAQSALNVQTVRGMIGITLVLISLPPAFITLLCNALSYPVFARVRGVKWTQSEMTRQAVWGLSARIAPALLAFVGFGALVDGELRLAMMGFAAAFVSRQVFVSLWVKAMDAVPHALTGGARRDRILALAQKAHVNVQQIYVLPAGKSQMANAFALRGNVVMLTDYLLQHLSKREVDAVVAHELAHLQRCHGRARAMTFGATLLLSSGLAGVLMPALPPNLWVMLAPVLLGLPALATYFVSRRCESAADAGAVALTGDPEALITALAKTTHLNVLPMQWSKWDERLLTHSSTLRRAQAIAQQNGISPERLQHILNVSLLNPSE
jgi:Zn-dependent protease with chaperone function